MIKSAVRNAFRTVALGALALGLFVSCQNPFGADKADATVASRAVTEVREPSQQPPNGLLPSEVPQFIMFGYDDNQYADGMNNILGLYRNRLNNAGSGNPLTFDGAPTTASFYVVPSGKSGADTWMTADDAVATWKVAYQEGHEIGNHTWDHSTGGLSRDYAGWLAEIQQCQDFLVTKLGMPSSEIVGLRVPFLEYNANTFQAAKAVGLIYDCSFEGGWRYWPAEDGSTMFWPFTMDNGKPAGEDGREFGKVPGMWQIPNDLLFYPGGRITGFDYNLWFKPMTKQEVVDILKYSLNKKYNGNRAPMNFGTHSNYYSANAVVDGMKYDAASWTKLKTTVEDRVAALKEFLDYAQTLPDVRIVSNAQALQWIRNPVKLGGAAPATHEITATAGTGGSIAPAGTQKIIAGQSKTYYIAAEPGYLLGSVVVDGKDMGKISSYTFNNVSAKHSISASFHKPTLENARKSSIFSMTSIAENSQTTLKFDYAENINDGRGITFGAVGFTSGTFDGTVMLKRLQAVAPSHPLVSYIPAFEAIDAKPHPAGKCDDVTGLQNFIADFTRYGNDEVVVNVQIQLIDEMYYSPALVAYNDIGAKLPITLGFLYDTCVNHGAQSWEDEKGLDRLVADATAAVGGTPKTGVNEITWLRKIMEQREAYLRSDPTWLEAADRVVMYRTLLDSGNTQLTNPFNVTCYGGSFTIHGNEIPLPEVNTFYTISTKLDSVGGTISPLGDFKIAEGSGINVLITADTGYVVDKVYVDGVLKTSGNAWEHSFTNVKANHTLSASFRKEVVQTFVVKASAGANGTISPSGDVVVEKGKSQTFTFTTAVVTGKNFAVDTVKVNGAAIANPGTSYTLVNIQANATIEVTFKEVLVPVYTITATAGANGSISPAGATRVEQGKSVTYTITPAAGYIIGDVKVDGVSKGAIASYTFASVSKDGSISASFVVKPTCTLPEWTKDGIYGTGVNEVHWKGADWRAGWWTQGQEPGTTGEWGVWKKIKDCGDVVQPVYFTVTATAGANGSISPAGAQQVEQGKSITFAIAAATGYKIADVTVDGASKGAVASVTVSNVQKNLGVVASFVKNDDPVVEYTITATAGANGSISPAGATKVIKGGSQKYTFAPASGYAVDKVTVAGTVVTLAADGSYTVANVQADTAISVSFKAVDTSIPAWSPDNVAYKLNDKVTHAGSTWICKYAHNSNSGWVPGTPGLWLWEKL